MSIPVPPDAEQKRYAAIVDSIESHRNVLARYLSDLNELFDSLQSAHSTVTSDVEFRFPARKI